MTSSEPDYFKSPRFVQSLDLLGQVAVNVALGLAPGQQLVMTAVLDALPLARRITEHAYKAGASLVTTIFTDEESVLDRFRYAPEDSFDTAPGWLFDGMAQAYHGGAARLAISGDDPWLLSNENPDKVSRVNRARSKAYHPAALLISNQVINWAIIPAATPRWAAAVFPELSAEDAVMRLWEEIFRTTRTNRPNPEEAWRLHDADLHKRAKQLNESRYAALHFRGPGTDLKVGMADDHWWLGGGTTARNGRYCICNMPTEEVYSMPHKDRVDGWVASTKPLSYQGTMIEGISVRFEAGKVAEAHAARGEHVLLKMIETDEGAARLGEVSLVPHSSLISASGLLFKNTLFDENAACHIALGQAYAATIRNGETLTEDELKARGANRSLIHVDWMIGSDAIAVDGISATGTAEPVMRNGEWV